MNVLVIMADTLRPDHVASLGSERVRTPNMDTLLAESVVFPNAIAEFPITVPSRTAFLTGCYTFTNRPWCGLRPGDVSFVSVLGSHGYATAAFSDTPFDQHGGWGFQEFQWFPGKCFKHPGPWFEPDVSDVYFMPGLSEQDKVYYKNTVVGARNWMDAEGMLSTEFLTREGLKWLKSRPTDKPFLLWLDYFEPHEPWEPPAPYDKLYADPHYSGRRIPMPAGDATLIKPEEVQHVVDMYDGCVTRMDEEVGKIIAGLKSLGLWGDTIVVFISDHGQMFGEHGQFRKFEVPVWEELARIVFAVRIPGGPKRTEEALIQNTDLAPTLYSLLNIPFDARPAMDGVDLMPLIKGDVGQVRKAAYTGAFQIRACVRTDEWKLVDNHGQRPNELFNIVSDPFEQNNLIEKESARAKRMHLHLWEFRAKWSGVTVWRQLPWGPTEV